MNSVYMAMGANMNSAETDYDVVLYVLQKHHDKLLSMTESNMKMDMMNIMDGIRFQQMDELQQAMNLWKNRKLLTFIEY